jgi:hypothetical protein
VDIDLVVPGGNGHGTPGVGDGAGSDCIIHRFPVVRIFGSGPGNVLYQVRHCSGMRCRRRCVFIV